MSYDLLIKQSYHGSGGSKGYQYSLFDSIGERVGALVDFPVNVNNGDIIELNEKLYKVTKIYDSTVLLEKEIEVTYYELLQFEYRPDYKLRTLN